MTTPPQPTAVDEPVDGTPTTGRSRPRPRPLTGVDLLEEFCAHLDCGLQASSGKLTWRDEGPFQLIARYRYRCWNGHQWGRETDGG